MNGQERYAHARNHRIPGGVHLRSKLPEAHAPGQWPPYFCRASGIDVWDVDETHYQDWTSTGIGASLLGYRDPDVTAAVVACVNEGSFSFLNPPEEVELADMLCDIHPWAQNVRLARGGGEIATIAVRVARATTDRSKVAVCGYHGWHDWYLAANLGENDSLRGHLLPNLNPLGVPRELRGTTFTFPYNDLDVFDALIAEHGDELACVIMEPCRLSDPDPGFLEHIRKTTRRVGALLIFDEVTIGWRRCFGGAHLNLGVEPDMAIFAKSLSNGHPCAALIGTTAAMDGAHASFISSTYWTERTGPVASLATLKKMQHLDVAGHVDRVGRAIVASWQKHFDALGLPASTEPNFSCFPAFVFDHEQADMMQLFFVQEMLKRGYLAGLRVYVTMAHDEEKLIAYDRHAGEVFAAMADAMADGDLAARLEGPLPVKGFGRLI